MVIRKLDNVAKKVVEMDGVEGAFKQVPLSREDGAPNFSFRVFTLEPGGHTPYHEHPFEHLNYVIRGKGAVVRETGEEKPVDPGDFVMVLPGERHQYKNLSSSEQFQFICAVPIAYE
jgi:quercetin dioxygenase-like cupin family protein